MKDAPAPVGITRTLYFIVRTFGRAVYFALAGAVVLAIAGAVVGALAGPMAASLLISSQTGPINSFSEHFLYLLTSPGTNSEGFLMMVAGASFTAMLGAALGYILFCVISVMAGVTRDPSSVLLFALRRAIYGSFAGFALGASIGIINGILLSFILPRPHSFARYASLIFASQVTGFGLLIGGILGFVIVTVYLTIKGTLTEIRRQRDKPMLISEITAFTRI